MSIYRRVLRYYRPFLGPTVGGLRPFARRDRIESAQALAVQDHRRPRFCRGIRPARFIANWPDLIPLLCLALVGIQLLWGLINLVTNYIFVKVGLQALLKLRTDLYAYLQSLSLKYHDARRSSRFQLSRRLRFAGHPDDLQQGLHQHLRLRHHAGRHFSASWCGSTGS